MQGSAKSDFVQYYGGTDRSLTNLYFPLRVSYRQDRYTFGFEGGFTRDNTLQSELQQTDWSWVLLNEACGMPCPPLQLESRNGCPGKAAISSRMRSIKMGLNSVS